MNRLDSTNDRRPIASMRTVQLPICQESSDFEKAVRETAVLLTTVLPAGPLSALRDREDLCGLRHDLSSPSGNSVGTVCKPAHVLPLLRRPIAGDGPTALPASAGRRSLGAGASPRDEQGSRASIGVVGAGASSEREPDRQPPGEPRTLDDSAAERATGVRSRHVHRGALPRRGASSAVAPLAAVPCNVAQWIGSKLAEVLR